MEALVPSGEMKILCPPCSNLWAMENHVLLPFTEDEVLEAFGAVVVLGA